MNPKQNSNIPQPINQSEQANSLMQNVSAPDLPKASTGKNKKMIVLLLLILIVCLSVVIGGYYFLNFSKKSNGSTASVVKTYVTTPASSASSPTPSDLIPQEQSVNNSLNQLNTDQKSVDQGLNDQPDNLNSL